MPMIVIFHSCCQYCRCIKSLFNNYVGIQNHRRHDKIISFTTVNVFQFNIEIILLITNFA